MSLSFSNVTYRYGAAGGGVSDVTLEVAPGEMVAVIGASGSGKTTLLRLAAGFLAPQSGRVAVAGRDMDGVPVKERNLGIVFQSYALFPLMTAAENVAYPLRLRGVARAERMARARAMLERVGLAAHADRHPPQLSGGQQQRVALARALAFRPTALLLDEPLSALDAAVRAELRDLIRAMQRESGAATLHVTHDQEEALSIADRVAVMAQGRLLQVADPVTLYDRPASVAVAAFVGHANLFDATVIAPGTIGTPLGALRADTEGFAPGHRAVALIRPERVAPTDTTTGENIVTGAPEADRFLGSLRRVDLRVGPALLRIETASRAPIASSHIPPDAILLLPSGETAP